MLQGLSLIGGTAAAPTGDTFTAMNPATGARLDPVYHAAAPDHLRRADALAADVFATYGRTTGAERAGLLRGIAAEIEALGDTLLERFVAESGLPRGRAESERRRTCDQLRLFAAVAGEGTWADARIDRADADRRPLPKPETRFLLRPVGPVVVFGPANFPLAFGVAGGDTASALAAGCPVIAKAHSSHPGTAELVGVAVVRAARACGLPAGAFSLIFGGRTVGAALVQLPSVRAVGFTGSRAAGHELLARCQRRPVPIPFFGELSAINPVCLLPGALAARAAVIAEGLHASMTMGCGQFCTKPGLVFYVNGAQGAQVFRDTLIARLRDTPAAPMLNLSTRGAYSEGLERLGGTVGVTTLVAAPAEAGPGGMHGGAALFGCEAATLRAQPALREEVFGPATLLVACRDLADMTATVGVLDGQLTATVHAADEDLVAAEALLWALEQRAGRLVFNGYPTGVEVCPSMVHGGPWPATTDSRFTSVGTAAMLRFARPVCYQNAPDACLPNELKNHNPQAGRGVAPGPRRDLHL